MTDYIFDDHSARFIFYEHQDQDERWWYARYMIPYIGISHSDSVLNKPKSGDMLLSSKFEGRRPLIIKQIIPTREGFKCVFEEDNPEVNEVYAIGRIATNEESALKQNARTIARDLIESHLKTLFFCKMPPDMKTLCIACYCATVTVHKIRESHSLNKNMDELYSEVPYHTFPRSVNKDELAAIYQKWFDDQQYTEAIKNPQKGGVA